MQIWISASLLVCPHFWRLACLRPFTVPSARHYTCVMECLLFTSMLIILFQLYSAVFTQHPAVQANPLAVLGLGLVGG